MKIKLTKESRETLTKTREELIRIQGRLSRIGNFKSVPIKKARGHIYDAILQLERLGITSLKGGI